MITTFDKNFYLVCNLDVLKAGIDGKKHYFEFGMKEHRIFNKSSCEKSEVSKNSDHFYSIRDLIQMELKIPKNIVLRVFRYKLPWRLGCEGFPSEIYEVSFINFRRFNLKIILNDDYIILPFQKLFNMKCYFVKYE
jgi:hypothetical protein